MQKLLLIILGFTPLFAFKGVIEPYATYKMHAPTSGIVASVAKKEQMRFDTYARTIVRFESDDDRDALASQERAVASLKEVVKLKTRTLKNKRKVSTISRVELDLEAIALEESRAQLAEMQRDLSDLRRRVQLTTVRAPANLTVGKIHVYPGEYVTEGSALFDLMDVTQRKIVLYLAEHELAAVKDGGIYVNGKAADFTLQYIAPVKDTTHISQFEVVLIAESSDPARVRFGQIVDVEFRP